MRQENSINDGDGAEDAEHRLEPGERELAAALGGLRPVAPGEAARGWAIAASVDAAVAGRLGMERRRVIFWRAAAAVLAVGLGLAMVIRPGTREVERVVEKVVFLPGSAGGGENRAVAIDGGGGEQWIIDGGRAGESGGIVALTQSLWGGPDGVASSGRGGRAASTGRAVTYLALRDQALRRGVDSIGATGAMASGAGGGRALTPFSTSLNDEIPAAASPSREPWYVDYLIPLTGGRL